MKKVQIRDCLLFNADCMEVLPTLDTVHLCVCDPPYGVGYLGNHRKLLEKQEMLANDEKPHVEFVPPIFRAVKDGGAIYLCTRFDVAQPWVDALTEAGARLKNPIYWIKDSLGLGDLEGDRGNAVEIILFAHVGRHVLRGKRTVNAWPISRAEHTLHPTTKPTELFKRCILQSSDPGDVVLDPFMGSGTAGIASVLTGRRFVGIELEPKYFDLSCERIEKAYREIDSRLPGFEPAALEEQGLLFN